MQRAGLDVVLRIYDTSELPRLDHCLFSLLGQTLPASPPNARLCGPLRLHLMLRRFSFAEVRAVRTATQTLRPLDQTATLTLHNWGLPEPFDLRLPLLNWGLAVTQGRYFTCLGVGDLVLPGAYAKLLMRLQSTRAAMALGGVLRQPVRWWGDVILPLAFPWPDLMPDGSQDAEAPPVFLLDRARLPPQDVVFRVGSPDAEVAEFVQRMRAQYLVDTEYMVEVLGVHQVPS
jgi:hypothetical protein